MSVKHENAINAMHNDSGQCGRHERQKDKKYRVEEGRKCQQDIVRREDDCDQQSEHMQKMKHKMDAHASKMRRRRQKAKNMQAKRKVEGNISSHSECR